MTGKRIALTKAIAISLAMVGASVAANVMTPTKRFSEERPIGRLEDLIPGKFGEWKEDNRASSFFVSPSLENSLLGVYSQILSRTYVNSDGYRIMLSLAYGGDQTRELQVHRPEVCYVAQGFQVSGIEKVTLNGAAGAVPAMRLMARQGQRIEPVTYWVRIGDKVVRGNVEQGVARLKYGISGYVADGLLFRVSSIDEHADVAFRRQESFVVDLLASTSPNNRQALLGRPNDT